MARYRNPNPKPRAAKGAVTDLNLFTLAEAFHGEDEIPNQIEPTSAAGLRRCFNAGLVAVSRDKKTLRLTDAGHAAIAEWTTNDPHGSKRKHRRKATAATSTAREPERVEHDVGTRSGTSWDPEARARVYAREDARAGAADVEHLPGDYERRNMRIDEYGGPAAARLIDEVNERPDAYEIRFKAERAYFDAFRQELKRIRPELREAGDEPEEEEAGDDFEILIDDEPAGTVSEFFAVNEYLDPDDRRAIAALKPGQAFEGGGGAAADFTITRAL